MTKQPQQGGKKTRRVRSRSRSRSRSHTQKKRAVATRKNRSKSTNVYGIKQFNSGDGMLTSVWGPSVWHSLHTISFNYPVDPSPADKKNYRDFVIGLQHVLPCKHCRINLKNNFKSLPLTMAAMKNRDTFSKYIYNLHELVNKMLKKSSGLTYSEVQNRYEHFRARCTTTTPKVWDIKNIEDTVNRNRKGGKVIDAGTEKGCTEPLYAGDKPRCIIKIVPATEGGSTFQMDQKCVKTIADKTLHV